MIPRLKSDLLALLYACGKGLLDGVTLEWSALSALTVVMATQGYPGAYPKGSRIKGLERAGQVPGVSILHAGTALNATGELVANGGRVLCVTAQAEGIAQAQKLAYQAVDLIDWPEGFCRRDIGWRALN
jgi:phosphoribosylamine--glycine ligase